MKLTSFQSLKHLSVLIAIGSVLTISACSFEKSTQAATMPTTASNTTSSKAQDFLLSSNLPPDSQNPIKQGETSQVGGSPVELMQDVRVKKELKMTDEQSNKIKAINDKAEAKVKQITANVNWAELKNDKKKQDELEAKLKAVVEPARDQLTKVLTKQQLDRFRQISLQVYGFGVLSYDQFSKDLNLSKDQEAKLSQLRRETLAEVRAKIQAPKDNSEVAVNKARETNKTILNAIFQESNAKAQNVLTAAQKAKIETLKGKDFKQPTT